MPGNFHQAAIVRLLSETKASDGRRIEIQLGDGEYQCLGRSVPVRVLKLEKHERRALRLQTDARGWE